MHCAETCFPHHIAVKARSCHWNAHGAVSRDSIHIALPPSIPLMRVAPLGCLNFADRKYCRYSNAVFASGLTSAYALMRQRRMGLTFRYDSLISTACLPFHRPTRLPASWPRHPVTHVHPLARAHRPHAPQQSHFRQQQLLLRADTDTHTALTA